MYVHATVTNVIKLESYIGMYVAMYMHNYGIFTSTHKKPLYYIYDFY